MVIHLTLNQNDKPMNESNYNGWANYETWNVKLWIDNEQGSSEYWREQAQSAYDAADDEDEAVRNLARNLEDHFEQQKHELLDNANLGSSMWADLLGAALQSVDWREIAESMIGEVDKDEESEENTND